MYKYTGKIEQSFLDKALNYLSRYSSDKEALKKRIQENQKWYKSNYARLVNEDGSETLPATSYIFSAIENKYADIVDNYPAPNFLEREEADADMAKLLSKVVSAELDIIGFKRVYKENARRKLKNGTAIYGIFYDAVKKQIAVKSIDILNIYCDMHIKNVQDSSFLFIVSCIENEVLKQEYPHAASLFDGNVLIEGYEESYTLDDRTEIVDCYYKTADGTVHMMKIAKDQIIVATEDMDGYEAGLYNHRLYPVVFDTLYPEEESPFGFGVIDVVHNIQQYIDKLDGAIIKNALLQSGSRFMVKENAGINEQDFRNLKKEIIRVAGDISDDSIRRIDYTPISELTLTHRDRKKDELKEIIGNRDFNQGGTNNGVIAASAIEALQSAGEKLSRVMSDDSYDAYKSIIVQVVEIIRQFYDMERTYRVINDSGNKEYKMFSNADIENSCIEFDIEVIPQRQNPFTQESTNQTIMSLWQAGVLADESIMSGTSQILIRAMSFDGKETLLSLLEEHKSKREEMQKQGQQQALQGGGSDELVAIDTKTGQILPQGGGSDELMGIDTTQL